MGRRLVSYSGNGDEEENNRDSKRQQQEQCQHDSGVTMEMVEIKRNCVHKVPSEDCYHAEEISLNALTPFPYAAIIDVDRESAKSLIPETMKGRACIENDVPMSENTLVCEEEKSSKDDWSTRVSLMVALFADGFICRHFTKDNECVEGFAQPYDAESSYFLACIDLGHVPDGLTNVIGCTHYNGYVLAEIRDYRATTTSCPASSAELPANCVSADPIQEYSTWKTILKTAQNLVPADTPNHACHPPLFERFPEVELNELETLAIDAQRELLEVVFPASPSESSICSDADLTCCSPRDNPSHSTDQHMAPGGEANKSNGKMRAQNKGSESRLPSYIKRKITRSHTTPEYVAGQSPPATRMKRSRSPRGKPRRSTKLSRSQKNQTRYASLAPLPATEYFLSKLKGKRKRQVPDELMYGKPAWMTIHHVGRFFCAAAQFERQHSQFLHINIQRLMYADKATEEDAENVIGSMSHLARHLGPATWPTDVIATAETKRVIQGEQTVATESKTNSPRLSLAMINPMADSMLLRPRMTAQSSSSPRFLRPLSMSVNFTDTPCSTSLSPQSSRISDQFQLLPTYPDDFDADDSIHFV